MWRPSLPQASTDAIRIMSSTPTSYIEFWDTPALTKRAATHAEAARETASHSSRLQLIFGPKSDTALTATTLISTQHALTRTLQDGVFPAPAKQTKRG